MYQVDPLYFYLYQDHLLRKSLALALMSRLFGRVSMQFELDEET
ncbi:hypothetical protein T12_7726 [Trichinella patagoniensis]|uniref:Uncharacterized protein n=1 Tax=Trichinella patagoniensis TaxID=990121 RepID=A0A0V0YUN5_9BILA|nr:hypothetical protein T12_7726 [Trichinella patagoniensis]